MTTFRGYPSWVILSALLLQLPVPLVHAQSCGVCLMNEVITLPDAIVPAGTAFFLESDLSCAEIASMLMDGSLSVAQCALLRPAGVPEICGCAVPPATPPPAVVPSPSPTGVPSPPPVPSPTEEPTRTPETSSPTASPVTDLPTATPIALPPPTPAPVVTDAPTDPPTTSSPVVTEAPTVSPVERTRPPRTAAPIADAPTDGPVLQAPPTMAPASNSTLPPVNQPTASIVPTPVPLPVLSGAAFVRMLTVGPGDLPQEADDGFKVTCEQFFAARIDEATDFVCFIRAYKVVPIPGTGRNLQDGDGEGARMFSLDATAEVQATSKTFEYEPSTVEFTDLIVDLINANSTDFAKELRETGSAASQLYYANVETVDAYQEGEAPTFPPTPPTPAPVPNAAPVGPPQPSSDDDRLSGGAIAGIVAACVVGAVVAVGGAKYVVNSSDPDARRPSVLEVGNPSGDFDPSNSFSPGPPTTSISTTRSSTARKVADEATAPTSSLRASSKQPVSSMASTKQSSTAPAAKLSGDPSGIKGTSDSNLSTGLASAQPSELGEDASAMTGSSEPVGDKDGEDQSYAYSLDAGNMDVQSAVAGTATKSGSGRDGLDKSESGSEMSSHAMSSLRQNMVSRTVIAPPGKLGIVIDTTLEGPVVHKVNPQSPLEGTLFPGDIIVAIDDVDTRAMSASAITALMVRTANLRRKLTVLSEDHTS